MLAALCPRSTYRAALLCSALTRLCVCDVSSAGWSDTILLCDSSERKSIILTGPALSLSLSLSSVPQLSASYLEYTHVVVKWANIHILHIQQHTRLQLIRPSLCATFASAVQTNHTSLIRLLCLSSTDVYIHLAYFYLFPTLLRSAIRFIVQVI
jgi:hypothetical protein